MDFYYLRFLRGWLVFIFDILMEDEQTNTTDTQGAETPVDTATDKAPTSLYDKTEAIVVRQEAANKKTEELLARQETLHTNQRLAGTTGGNVPVTPAKEESPKEYSDRIQKEIQEGKHGD